MNPILVKIGPINIYWYGAMMALAFLSAVVNCIYLGRGRGKSSALISDMIFWMAIAGLVGARIAFVAANLDEYAQRPITALFLHEGGLVFYGGVIGGVLGILAFSRSKHEHPLFLLDIVAVAAPLGHALGRIGCFLNGCCYGSVYNGPLAVPLGGARADAEFVGMVHPVQLYEAGANVLLYAALMWLFSRRLRYGTVGGAYLVAYGVTRFVVEFFRGDPRLMVAGLTAAQVTSVCLIVIAVIGLIWVYKRGNKQADS